jgi:hypothetical protein
VDQIPTQRTGATWSGTASTESPTPTPMTSGTGSTTGTETSQPTAAMDAAARLRRKTEIIDTVWEELVGTDKELDVSDWSPLAAFSLGVSMGTAINDRLRAEGLQP